MTLLLIRERKGLDMDGFFCLNSLWFDLGSVFDVRTVRFMVWKG